jgi:Cu-Zn family superoxide dismutase
MERIMLRQLPLWIGTALAVAGCSGASGPAEDGRLPPMQEPAGEQQVRHVTLEPTEGHTASGMLTLSQAAGGLRVTGRLAGLPAGRELAFHVHEVGDCSAPDAASAGEHFNPDAQPHGGPDSERRHAGDMPNLDVDAEGVAEVDVLVADLQLDGPADRRVDTRAIVVHAEADDYETQPSGDSGDRIACGVIGAAHR